MRRSLALVSLAVLLGGCPDEVDRCAPGEQNAAVLELVRSWYLYPELLPPQVSPGDYADPGELLDALTAEAQAQGKDRGWSFVTTLAATQSFYDEGTSVGFGFGILVRGSQVFVSQVFAGSAADDAGFVRGDEILAIGEPPAAPVPVSQLSSLGAALGPSEPGVTRSFEMLPVGGGPPQLRTATKRTFSLRPVPEWSVIPRAGPPAGYVSLRSFIGPADARLRLAFQEFQDAGVTDVVVDLRYNGGGLIATAELLADLLAGGREGSVMYALRNNPLHALSDFNETFDPQPEAIAPLRIAFVTTGASASASELVPNALEPYVPLALVGKRTYGKPVGQRGFILEGCDTVVYLVSFRLENAQGDGDYFLGLPDDAQRFSGPLCDAEDQLDLPQSSPLEASTAAALHFLETGACPAPLAAAAGATAPVVDVYPAAPQPSFAQRNVRGLF